MGGKKEPANLAQFGKRCLPPRPRSAPPKKHCIATSII
jgi:hypothetical protein